MESEMTEEDYLNLRNEIKIRKFHPDTCVVKHVLTMLQGKWANHILFELFVHDVMRFGQFKQELPQITNTMLTATLRELESNQLISRTQFNEIPPRVEYALTKSGRDLVPVFYEMFKWGEKYQTALQHKESE